MSATRPCCEFSIGIIAPRGAAFAHRVERVLEAEAGQRQAVGRELERGAMRVAAGRALEGDRARGIGGGGGGHCLDESERGSGEAVHDGAALSPPEGSGNGCAVRTGPRHCCTAAIRSRCGATWALRSPAPATRAAAIRLNIMSRGAFRDGRSVQYNRRLGAVFRHCCAWSVQHQRPLFRGGQEPAAREDGPHDRGRGLERHRCRGRADRGSPRQGRPGQGRAGVQEVHLVPRDHPGRTQRHRSRPLPCGRRGSRPGSRRLRVLRCASRASAAAGTSRSSTSG